MQNARAHTSPRRPTCLDLFSGCGGFTLGMEQAGFRTLAAIDFDPHAMAVFRENFPHVPNAFCADLTTLTPADLAQRIGSPNIDVIVGGPPCQGFSHVRQRDGANNGSRLIDDPRRSLYRPFLEYVAFFRPAVFVMENVLGIRSADSGRYFAAVQQEARRIGYRVHGQVVRAADFGCPQKRQRQLIIGTRTDLPGCFRSDFIEATHSDKPVTLGEVICDLPPIRAGGGMDPAAYDLDRRRKHILQYGSRYILDVLEVHRATELTAHVARPHSDRDLRDFARLREGEHAAQAIARGQVLESPYDRSTFHDRYTRQHRNHLCSTIVAHLSKDGLMFVHPTQNRSLTPREAARIQSFPDWFKFSVARTHQFRMIGNAVPPLVARAVGRAVRRFLMSPVNKASSLLPIPKNNRQALSWLIPLTAGNIEIQDVPRIDFNRAWASIFFLFPGLHPDNIPSKNEAQTSEDDLPSWCPDGAAHLANPFYEHSGWPVALAPLQEEAGSRYDRGLLTDAEFYPLNAQRAGILSR